MTIADDSCPNPLIKSLSILKNEGIILEMLDKEMADRMKKDKQQQQLAKATGGDLKFKNRSYTIIVPFLPTHTTLENTDSLKNIEEDNDLSTRSTAEVRWIKPPSCRENTQQVAHAMFYMTDSEAANKLIRDRLYANYKKEPMCCLKCQHWGYMVKVCKANSNTCNTCTGEHRTTTCVIQQSPHYVNCNTSGHAS
ncbi:hypothetical protein J3A83DRAFT_4099842 [Scleroderma citrinum]